MNYEGKMWLGFFSGIAILVFCCWVGEGLNYYLHNVVSPLEIKKNVS